MPRASDSASTLGARVMISGATLLFGVLMVIGGAFRQVTVTAAGITTACGHALPVAVRGVAHNGGEVGATMPADLATSCQHQAQVAMLGPVIITVLGGIWFAWVLRGMRKQDAGTASLT